MAIEILAYEETCLGPICLRRRELLCNPGTVVTEVTLNHEFLMSSYLTDSERALARIGLEMIADDETRGPDKLQVLVGGLGLGYTAAEALKSDRVGNVEVVEFLPEVIGWLSDDLIPLSRQLKISDRLTVTEGDIYARLAGAVGQRLDLIVIDVDHSPEDVLGDQSSGFYSESGLRRAQSHLTPTGVLGVWSYAESSPLLEKMIAVFPDVQVQHVTIWNDLINEEQTDWLFFGSNRPRSN